MTFDLDDTLYDNHPVIRALEHQLKNWLESRYPNLARFSGEDWFGFKQQAINKQPELRHDVTKARTGQLFLAFKAIGLDCDATSQAITDTMQQVYVLRNQVTVPHSSLHTLQQLSNAMPLVAITNGNVDLQQIGIDGYFQHVLKAGESGRAKPFSDMFDKACTALELQPQQVLHVGDHLISDVAGAKRAGLQAAWFNDKPRTLITASKLSLLPDIEINSIPELLDLI